MVTDFPKPKMLLLFYNKLILIFSRNIIPQLTTSMSGISYIQYEVQTA